MDTSTTNQRFQTFITRLRPHRIAILTDIADPDWQKTCLRIIEYLSQIWGGAYSIIIPTDGKIISDMFWEVLSAFDADIIYRYQKSGSDIAHNTPDIFEGWVAQELKEAIEPEHAEPQIRASLLKMPIEDPTFMSENLVRQLLIRLSPLHYGGFFNVNYVSSSDVPGYPLTSMSDVIDKTEKVPDHIFEVKDDIPPTLSTPPVLWMLAESGIANKNYQAHLEAKGIKTIPKSLMNDSEYDVIKWGIQPSTVFGANSPFAISRLALKGVGPVARMFDVASVIVVGDTMADFCLHYALSRMQGRALWMPSWFMPKDNDPYPSRMIKAIRIMEDMGRREQSRAFDVISTSVEAEKLDSLAERMKQHIQMVNSRERIQATSATSELSLKIPCAGMWRNMWSASQPTCF